GAPPVSCGMGPARFAAEPLPPGRILRDRRASGRSPRGPATAGPAPPAVRPDVAVTAARRRGAVDVSTGPAPLTGTAPRSAAGRRLPGGRAQPGPGGTARPGTGRPPDPRPGRAQPPPPRAPARLPPRRWRPAGRRRPAGAGARGRARGGPPSAGGGGAGPRPRGRLRACASGGGGHPGAAVLGDDLRGAVLDRVGLLVGVLLLGGPLGLHALAVVLDLPLHLLLVPAERPGHQPGGLLGDGDAAVPGLHEHPGAAGQHVVEVPGALVADRVDHLGAQV